MRNQRNDHQSVKSKCVVFGQFVGVLDGRGRAEIRGIGFVRIDGKMKL
jgi:hypothetical protein